MRFLAALLLCVLALASETAARADGLSGVVIDASGRPVPGAVVTVASPDLKMSVTAGRSRSFSIVWLPPGTYVLAASRANPFAFGCVFFVVDSVESRYQPVLVSDRRVLDGCPHYRSPGLVDPNATADLYVIH